MSKQIIEQCRKENNVFVFKNMFKELPTWENFLDHISDGFGDINFTSGNYNSKEVVGKVNFWSKLTMTLEVPETKYYKELDTYINTFKDFQDKDFSGSFCIVSFTNKEPTTGRHSDPVDVFYLQCLGSVIWKIGSDEKVEKYMLNPGDVIYVPSNIMHEIVSINPRAAISFMFK